MMMVHHCTTVASMPSIASIASMSIWISIPSRSSASVVMMHLCVGPERAVVMMHYRMGRLPIAVATAIIVMVMMNLMGIKRPKLLVTFVLSALARADLRQSRRFLTLGFGDKVGLWMVFIVGLRIVFVFRLWGDLVIGLHVVRLVLGSRKSVHMHPWGIWMWARVHRLLRGRLRLRLLRLLLVGAPAGTLEDTARYLQHLYEGCGANLELLIANSNNHRLVNIPRLHTADIIGNATLAAAIQSPQCEGYDNRWPPRHRQ
mmetsp:Transcript_130799/g.279805  ORF Transcript_130799/g.279805 Transcript_130799/m.279805 type:complete len:259 (+) Transcript_130799:79-855(+)